MKTPEGFVKDKVRKYLKSIGAYRFSPVQVGLGAATLDDLCCIGGRFVGIEYKREGKLPTPRQRLTMTEMRRAGGIAIWGDDAAKIIEDLKQALGLPD
ncbi:MAG: hypothetical protein WC829_01335 [Hyphomicrobium sp.]|jgi:hypothetical protein